MNKKTKEILNKTRIFRLSEKTEAEMCNVFVVDGVGYSEQMRRGLRMYLDAWKKKGR